MMPDLWARRFRRLHRGRLLQGLSIQDLIELGDEFAQCPGLVSLPGLSQCHGQRLEYGCSLEGGVGRTQ